MTALDSFIANPKAKAADEAAWSELVYRLKSVSAGERLLALEQASDLLGAAILRGELDGESANGCMIALLAAFAAVANGIPRVCGSPFTYDC